MGRTNYLLTLITEGEWKIEGEKWYYVGDRKAKALVIYDSIKFDTLKKRIAEKVAFDDERYELKLKYLSPHHHQSLPPFDILDDEDLEAYKFLNTKSSKDGVWPIELYATLNPYQKKMFVEEKIDRKPFDFKGSEIRQEVRVSLSAPPTTQGEDKGFDLRAEGNNSDTIRNPDRIGVAGGRISLADDRTLDEILEEDNERIYGFHDRTPIADDMNKNRNYYETEVLALSSDEEEIVKSTPMTKGKEVVVLTSEDEQNDVPLKDRNLEDRWYDDLVDDFGHEESTYDMDEAFLREVEEIEENCYRSQGTSGAKAEFVAEKDNDGAHMPKEIKVGDYFRTKKELQDVLTSMAVRECFQLDVRKSDKKTYVAGCKDMSCIFICRGSIFGKTNMFLVRKFIGVHSCGMRARHNHHKNVTASMIAEKMIPKFAGGSKGIRANDIIREMKESGVEASYHKANRARLKAEDMVRGSAEESYSRVHSWMYMLKMSNPGSHTSIARDDNQRFKYAFWTLGAWVRAMPHLRKVISVDGTHLSVKYRGVLLLATAQDGNKQIYPLAYCVVDSENDASWSFFFKELKVVVPDIPEVVFITDRHASIMRGFRNNYTFAKQGYYTFHIYQNFKARCHRGDLLYLWNKVAKAYTVQEFNDLFSQLCKEAPDVGEYVMTAGFNNWSRAHFPYNTFNIMTTNNAESMNSRFKDERGWPIVAMFDGILEIMCKWFCERREKAGKWDDVVTKEVKDIVDSRYTSSITMIVNRLSQFEAEVTDSISRFEVNLQARTCSCRVFQVDHIPCTHAIAAAKNRGIDVADLVDPFFKTDHLREVYKETLHPVPPVERWDLVPPSVVGMTCHPPQVRRPAGRPKTNRFRAHWEKNLTKSRKCGRCGKRGHYQTRCRAPMP